MVAKSGTFLLKTARYIGALDTTKLVFVSLVMLLVFQTSVVVIRFARHDFSIAFTGSESYSQIAKNMVNNGLYSLDGSHPTAYRPPLYPLFLAPFIVLFGDSFSYIAIISQSVLDVISGILVLFISLRIFKTNLGAFISVSIYTLHYLFHKESIHQRETILFTFLLVLFFYLIMGKRSILIYSVLSCVAALSYLTRPTGIILFPLIFVDLLLQERKMLVKYAFAALASALVVVAPWQVYMYRSFHTFSLMPSLNGGMSLYHGNNPDFQTVFPWIDIDHYAADYGSDLKLEHKDDIDFANPIAANRFFKNEAYKFIFENPMVFIQNAALKVFALYSPLPVPLGRGELVGKRGEVTIKDFRFYSGPSVLAHVFLVTIMLLGLILSLKNITLYSKQQKIQIGFIISLIIVVTLFHIMTRGETRYRLPLDPLLIVLAGEAYSRFLKNRYLENNDEKLLVG